MAQKSCAHVVFLACIVFASSSIVPASAQDIRARFEKLAAEMRFFCTGEFVYDRSCGRGCQDCDFTKEDLLLHDLDSYRLPINDRVSLLTHDDPKVRTLAMAGLYATGDVQVLPYIAAMTEDSGSTYDEPDSCNCPPKHQTVGEIAKRLMGFYLEASTDRDFAEYWRKRKNRKYCASWFEVALTRASGGITPTREDRIPRIKELRHSIDLVPLPDRLWILLWLAAGISPSSSFGEPGSDALATQDEVLAFAQRVGPDKLMMMLNGSIPSDDPDLVGPNALKNGRYNRMIRFVLEHASMLLRKEYAPQLFSREAEWKTPWWPIAASELQPQHASQWLAAAFERYQGENEGAQRSDLAAAMWRTCGPSQMQFLVNWLYEEKRPCRGSYFRGYFFAAITKRPMAEQKTLVSTILHDPRFQDLDWMPLKQLIDIVNGWVNSPLLEPSHFENKVSQMYGEFDCVQEERRTSKKIPKDDRKKDLFIEVDKWRDALDKSEIEWAN